MKTRPEFRRIALVFAKRNGFDTVHFQGMLNNFEVYTGGYKVDCVVGLPQIILTDGKTVKLDEKSDPFKILDSCKKLPKVIFEYDCAAFFGNSYAIQLLEDGRLVRYEYAYSRLAPEDHMFGDEEFILLNSPELVREIKKLIKENKEELRKISRDVSNPTICDGAVETFRFGNMKFEVSNILNVSMEGYKENMKKYTVVEMGWEAELLQFQRLFKKFRNKFNEYVDEPLFNGGEEL